MEKYITPKEASKILGVHWQTLKNWEKQGKITCVRTPGGKRMYNVEKYIMDNDKTKNKNVITDKNKKRNICYCRVSTRNQKNDLNKQVKYMREQYPKHEIMTEIASGLNFKRPKLMKIINIAIGGDLEELVVTHNDRLARFGYELIENIIKTYSNGHIIVINKVELSPEEEITKDLVSIINVFSVRVNGLRKYANQVKNI